MLSTGMGRVLDCCFYALQKRRLQNVLDSPEFKERLGLRRGLFQQHPIDSPEGAILRVPPALASALIAASPLSDLSAPLRKLAARDEDSPAIATETMVQMLGEATLAEASKVLPPEALALVPEFRAADPKGQASVLRSLQSILASKSGEGRKANTKSLRAFALDDLKQQPISRIVPRAYGNWRNGGNPNCFGKGQMLIAWARLAQAEVLGVSPVTSAYDFASPYCTQVGRFLFNHAVDHGVTLHLGLLGSFCEQLERDALEEEFAEAFHMAAVIRLKDGTWFLVDPHMRVCGPLTSPLWQVEDGVSPLLRKYRETLPGLSLLATDPLTCQLVMKQGVVKALHPIDVVSDLLRQWRERGSMRFFSCFTLFTYSEAPKLLLDSRAFFNNRDRWFLDAVLSGEDTLHLGLAFRDPRYPDQAASPEMTQKVNVSMLVLDRLMGGRLLPVLLEGPVDHEKLVPLLEEGMFKAFSALYALAFRNFRELFQTEGDGDTGIIHPAMEFYLPEYRVGVEMVSHFNARSSCDESVIAELAQLTAGQLHQLACATAPLRNGGEMTKAAKLSAMLLQLMPVKYRTITQGLSQLQESGLLEKGTEDADIQRSEGGQESPAPPA